MIAEPRIEAAAEAMRDYYARRAAYYERVYFKPERQADLRAMEAWIGKTFAGRRVLEIACGTGWWTPHGARNCTSWLATDINPGTMALAQQKPLPPGKVRFATVDAYTMAGLEAANFDAEASDGGASFDAEGSDDAASFDAAFAGCWWSHVPLARLPGWLELLHARLQPGARIVMLDNSFVQTSNLPIHRRDDDGNTYQLRTLDDGSVHEVLKNFPTREQAFAMLGPRACRAQWHAWQHYWAIEYELA